MHSNSLSPKQFARTLDNLVASDDSILRSNVCLAWRWMPPKLFKSFELNLNPRVGLELSTQRQLATVHRVPRNIFQENYETSGKIISFVHHPNYLSLQPWGVAGCRK
jgi:hypothetical protein